jgi:hypothetical protein
MITNKFTSNIDNPLIITFSGNIVIKKVVDNFVTFPKNRRTLNFELLCEIYAQNTKLERN